MAAALMKTLLIVGIVKRNFSSYLRATNINVEKQQLFGDGNSDKQFLAILQNKHFWQTSNKSILQPTSATKLYKEDETLYCNSNR